MLLVNMKTHLLQKLRLNILKTSSQTELKRPVENLLLLNEFLNIYKEKETALFTMACFQAATKRNDNRAFQMKI